MEILACGRNRGMTQGGLHHVDRRPLIKGTTGVVALSFYFFDGLILLLFFHQEYVPDLCWRPAFSESGGGAFLV